MRAYSIVGVRPRRRDRATTPAPAATVIPDLFERDFKSTEPGRRDMGDSTRLPLTGGRLRHLVTVLDRFSRKVGGLSTADHTRTGLRGFPRFSQTVFEICHVSLMKGSLSSL
ncbi:hypothetical protein [Kitasatospora sp. NRRL B-11411]|uniref:hypothetical protein n=1 Tax=Kitasatospora sp. NRRL B-11411 TaxID=1463822 RepID=UPI00069026FF|nr:hypothetical protein [Kitasatospora sp. NRRL B-11411]